MKKKIGISFIIIAFVLFGIATIDLITPGKGSILTRTNKLGLSIDDFELVPRTKKREDYSWLELDLKNNSNYDIVEVKAKYKVKDNLSKEEEKLFKEILEDEDNEGIKASDINIEIDKDTLIKKGETYEDITFLEFGSEERGSYLFNAITEEIFKLMEVQEFRVVTIAKDGQLYIATYNGRKKSWDIEEANGKANIWPEDNELTSEISRPPFDYFIIVNNAYSPGLNFKAYNITKEDYINYVKNMKTSGFSKNASKDYEKDGMYRASNSAGRNLTIIYYPTEEKLIVTISKY